jgi:hypothetical protein
MNWYSTPHFIGLSVLLDCMIQLDPGILERASVLHTATLVLVASPRLPFYLPPYGLFTVRSQFSG